MSATATISGVVSKYSFREAANGKKANLWMLVEWPSSNPNAQWPDRLAVKAFGAVAERADRVVRQGVQITAECKIEPKSDTNQRGDKIYTTEFILQSFRTDEDQSEAQTSASGKGKAAPQGAGAGGYYDPIADPDGDIPF